MKTILTILAFITLIAVIFGVSMHQAFWGTVMFIMLAIFGVTIWYSAKYWLAGYSKVPEAKIVKKKKEKITPRGIIITISVVLYLLSPALLYLIIYLISPSFTVDHVGVTLLVIASPYLIPALLLLLSPKNKKRTRK